ncbi:hypothetical protein ACFLRO_00590 [Bacteroidota bacterium]
MQSTTLIAALVDFYRRATMKLRSLVVALLFATNLYGQDIDGMPHGIVNIHEAHAEPRSKNGSSSVASFENLVEEVHQRWQEADWA